MKYLLCLMAFLLLSNCASKSTIFHWGSYESIIYTTYTEPGKITLEKQIAILSNEIEKANEDEHKIAPGIYAHLAMLLMQNGQDQMAVVALKMEKKLYPESSVMINGILTRAFPDVPLDDNFDVDSDLDDELKESLETNETAEHEQGEDHDEV